MTVLRPKPINDILLNPGMGWMVFSGERPDRYGLWPLAHIAYLRVAWALLEPEEGKYNWEHPAWEPTMRFWIRNGKHLAFRIMCTNAHSSGYWTTPEWVAKAGAKGREYMRSGETDPAAGGKPIPRWEPDYSDPVFLEKLENFVQALAKRYDGDPNIEFIDIGSYGLWGEWHTPNPAPVETQKKLVDMHVSAFKKTRLVVCWGSDQSIPFTSTPFRKASAFAGTVSAGLRWDEKERCTLRRGTWHRSSSNGGETTTTWSDETGTS